MESKLYLAGMIFLLLWVAGWIYIYRRQRKPPTKQQPFSDTRDVG